MRTEFQLHAVILVSKARGVEKNHAELPDANLLHVNIDDFSGNLCHCDVVGKMTGTVYINIKGIIVQPATRKGILSFEIRKKLL